MDEFDDFVSSPTATANATAATPEYQSPPAESFNPDEAMNDFLKREKEALPQEDFLQDEAPKSAPTTQEDKPPAPKESFTSTSLPTSAKVQQPQEDSDAMKSWKAKQDEGNKEKIAASQKRHEATIAKARKEIDAFYEDYNTKKAKAIARNKEQEAAFLKQRDELKASQGGSVWERVVNQIDLNQTATSTIKKEAVKSKDGKKEVQPEKEVKRDTSRFKSMLLQLKNDPKAPGNEIKA